jgi:hypothetical protein
MRCDGGPKLLERSSRIESVYLPHAALQGASLMFFSFTILGHPGRAKERDPGIHFVIIASIGNRGPWQAARLSFSDPIPTN